MCRESFALNQIAIGGDKPLGIPRNHLVQLKVFNVLLLLIFVQGKKAETKHVHSYVSKQCYWCACALASRRQKKLKYYFHYLDFLTGNVVFL